MAVLPDYTNLYVVQRNPNTGCIPAGIEWMLRFTGIKGIDYSDFQERFDLESQGKGGNGFYSVSRAVSAAYPHLKFQCMEFATGKEKLAFVEALIAKGEPCLISLARSPQGGWHIVPVVEIDDKIVKVLWMDMEKQSPSYQRDHFEFIHDNWPGGKDILALMG